MIEFEEMQKVWNEKTGENMFSINERELYDIVIRRKDTAHRRINNTEIMLTIINGIICVLSIVLAISNPHPVNFMNAGIMGVAVVYIQYFRRKRKREANKFDRSILGELDHAIAHERSTVRFNTLMVVGYVIPLAIVGISALISASASLDKWVITMGAFLLSIVILGWEQAAGNVPRRNQLLALRKILTQQ